MNAQTTNPGHSIFWAPILDRDAPAGWRDEHTVPQALDILGISETRKHVLRFPDYRQGPS